MAIPSVAAAFHALAAYFRATPDQELAYWANEVAEAFLGDLPSCVIAAARREGFAFGMSDQGHTWGWRVPSREEIRRDLERDLGASLLPLALVHGYTRVNFGAGPAPTGLEGYTVSDFDPAWAEETKKPTV